MLDLAADVLPERDPTSTPAVRPVDHAERLIATAGPISAVIADDDHLVRIGLRGLLDGEDSFTVAGEASDGLSAVRTARRARPDVILIDIPLPGIDGIEVTRRITADPALASTKIIILTALDDQDLVLRAIRSGAVGYLLKTTRPATLLTAIRDVAGGHAHLDAAATRTVIHALVDQPSASSSPHPWLGTLTDREREVVTRAAQGLRNEEIATALEVSPSTIRTHVRRAMMKLHARHRAQLVSFAYQSGLV